MNEQIVSLMKLQELDLELDRVTEEFESIPERIQQQKDLSEELKKNSEQKKNELKTLQVEHKKLELDLASKEQEINKHRVSLNSLKTNEQYSVALSEISKCQSAQDKIETEILAMLEKIDKANQEMKNSEKEIQKKEGGIQERIKNLENRKTELEKELETSTSSRNEFAKNISPVVLKKYEHIRSSRDGVGITPVVRGACGSCHIKLIEQLINEVTKVAHTPQSNDLVYCDNCSRILYIEEPVKPPAPPQIQKEPPAPDGQESVEQVSNEK